jgi:hypothetical protein
MTLKQHLVITGVAVVALAPVLDAARLALFAVGGVLIDVDHYLLYIQRRRNFSVSGMFRYYEELQPIQASIPYVGLCLFHTIDCFLLVAVLGYFYPVLYALLAGLLFHFLFDLFDLWRKKALLIRAFFLVEHLIRRRAKGYPWY